MLVLALGALAGIGVGGECYEHVLALHVVGREGIVAERYGQLSPLALGIGNLGVAGLTEHVGVCHSLGGRLLEERAIGDDGCGRGIGMLGIRHVLCELHPHLHGIGAAVELGVERVAMVVLVGGGDV